MSEIVLENCIIKIVLSLLIVHTIVYCDKSSNEVFQFPEFAYKETTKNVSEILHLLIFHNLICIHSRLDTYADLRLYLILGAYLSRI